MRIAVLLAASVLVAGCSQAQQSQPGKLTPISRTSTAARDSPTSTASSTVKMTPAPGQSATPSEALSWVESAGPVDAADFHVALRGGTSTPLADDVAFTTPFGTTCMTDVKRGAGLACLVNLTDPPPQPPDIYGVWKGGWVDFDGTSVVIGSAHGDPGRFALGQGGPLPEGRSLSFGDYRCRTDATALVCANFAHRTAVRYSDDGVDTYGCARVARPAAGVGIQYSC